MRALLIVLIACTNSVDLHETVPCGSGWAQQFGGSAGQTGLGTCDLACQAKSPQDSASDPTTACYTAGPSCASSFVVEGVRGCCVGQRGPSGSDTNDVLFVECTSLLNPKDAGS